MMYISMKIQVYLTKSFIIW